MVSRSNHVTVPVRPIATLLRGFILGAGATAALVTLTASAYLAKSAMGINLMTAHSPLHDILFVLVK